MPHRSQIGPRLLSLGLLGLRACPRTGSSRLARPSLTDAPFGGLLALSFRARAIQA